MVDVVADLRRRLRGEPRRPTTGEGAVETLPGQIRRPDVGVGCGRRDPNGSRAAEPRMVLDVLSPGPPDFGSFEELAEHEGVEAFDQKVYVDPDCAAVVRQGRLPGLLAAG